jgi:hypothetical protein
MPEGKMAPAAHNSNLMDRLECNRFVGDGMQVEFAYYSVVFDLPICGPERCNFKGLSCKSEPASAESKTVTLISTNPRISSSRPVNSTAGRNESRFALFVLTIVVLTVNVTP